MDIKDRFLTEDGKVAHDPAGQEHRQQQRKKVIATTKDSEQRSRVGRKHALIEKHGEKKYDALVREHGAKVLEY